LIGWVVAIILGIVGDQVGARGVDVHNVTTDGYRYVSFTFVCGNSAELCVFIYMALQHLVGFVVYLDNGRKGVLNADILYTL